MTILSAGIKNLFGCVPGLQKPEMHYRYPNIDDFSNMLVELAQTVKPDITVIDAIDGMEGNGPNAGDPRHLGLTFASRDVFTQDCFAASYIGLDPDRIPMLKIAKAKGLAKPEEAELIGDGRDAAAIAFKLPSSSNIDFLTGVPDFIRVPLNTAANALLKPMPKLTREKCIGCGKCAESCPPQIITISDKKAHFKRKGCISCFCCQEMCPAHAIEIKRVIFK